MAQAIQQHGLAAARECGHHTEVGHISGREEERARTADECGELFFERRVLPPMTADQVRGATACAAVGRARRHGGGERWMRRKSKIVVAAEVDEPAAVDDYLRVVGRFRVRSYRRAVTSQMLPLDFLERRLKRLSLHYFRA